MAMNYGLVGNSIGAVLLCCVAAYTIAVLGQVLEWWTLVSFGVNWISDGFCLSFKNSMLHTHLLCLYGNTVCSLILFILAGSSKREELANVRVGVGSVLMHGIGHAYVWYTDGTLRFGSIDETGLAVFLSQYVFLILFFLIFVYKPNAWPTWMSLALSVLHSIVLTNVPPIFIFPYVNLVITTTLIVALFASSPRDVFYPLQMLTFCGPVSMAFLEPLLCDQFLINYGGHLFYDLIIPFGFFVYYFVASGLPPRPCPSASKVKGM